MAQDIVSDALNRMMNAKRAGKTSLTLSHHSKLLLSILAIAKLKGHVKEYKLDGKTLKIEIGSLNGCNAIKPRYTIQSEDIEKYVRRYLPAKNIGTIIVSTSQGLMTHQTALDKGIGGCLLAYIY